MVTVMVPVEIPDSCSECGKPLVEYIIQVADVTLKASCVPCGPPPGTSGHLVRSGGTRKPTGRPRLTGEHYAMVAFVWQSSESPKTKNVAKVYQVSYSTADRWVGEARKRGLLGQN